MYLIKTGSRLLLQSCVIILYIISSGILFNACDKETDKADETLNEKLNFNLAEYQLYLKERLSSADSTERLIIDNIDTLKQYYASRNYDPVFIKSFDDKELIESVLNLLSSSGEHGLNPEEYHSGMIRESFEKAFADSPATFNRYIHLAEAEVLIGDGILKYSYHLRYGAVNPKTLFPDSYFLPAADLAYRNLFEPFKQENIFNYLAGIQPGGEKYKSLQSALKQFERYKERKWPQIYISKKKIQPGDEDPALVSIADRLTTLGFLDTAGIKNEDLYVYDLLLLASVKRFQKVNGLNDDGVIGKSTVDKLNVTPGEYINKIKLSLERFRWIDYSHTPEYILVNIPDFTLYVIEKGIPKISSKVCTGKKRSIYFERQNEIYKKNKNWRSKPDDWETPVLYAEVSRLVLNPTWTVPQTIMREEIASELRKDSTYLQRKNFKIYKEGKEIAAAQVISQEFRLANIPYRIVQEPGIYNALGRIKFMFDNPFGIYLHDTPVRTAFALSNRAVSHGCVRVEKPLALSEFLIKHQSRWNIDYLKIEVGSAVEDKSVITEYREIRNELRKNSSYGKTTELKLDKIVPLYIDYYTAWVDQEGNVNFRDDVYGKDQKLLEHLLAEGNIIKD